MIITPGKLRGRVQAHSKGAVESTRLGVRPQVQPCCILASPCDPADTLPLMGTPEKVPVKVFLVQKGDLNGG